jgi:UDP-GlcNAc:undecaprenyl-phosphate GlcNAc-1-phosphate transferase
MTIQLISIFIVLFLLEYAYIKVSQYYKILDLPNERSSHQIPTIRGGGIVFVIAAFLYFSTNNFPFPYLISAVFLAGIISFWDDVRSLPNKLRFLFHLVSMLLVFYQLDLFQLLSPIYIVFSLIIFIGIINAYNFMDGINGITALYSLSIIVPFYLTETDELISKLELYILLAIVVFSIFNIRKKALVFAGDVGSIAMSILIVFLLITRIIETNNFSLIGCLIIYGVDTIYTLMFRLYKRENIFQAHRQHLYQYLTNEGKFSHLVIAFTYAFLQIIINFYLLNQAINWLSFGLLVLILSIVYWTIKMKYIAKRSSH